MNNLAGDFNKNSFEKKRVNVYSITFNYLRTLNFSNKRSKNIDSHEKKIKESSLMFGL